MPLGFIFNRRENARADARDRALADVIPAGLHVNAVEIGAEGDEWLRIVPFGEFPFHHSGGHAITPEAGAQMVANFAERPGGLLFDVDHDSLWGRTKAAAWSNELEVRNDGVYCRRPELTPYGEGEVAGGQYRFFSPVYALAAVNKRGEQIGAVLLSVAYTNTPYFDQGEIDPVPNSALTNPPRPVDAATLQLLGLPEDATDEQIANAVQAMHARANAAPATPAADPTLQPAGPAGGDAAPGDGAGADRLAALEARLAAIDTAGVEARANSLVEAAVNAGKIKPAQRALFLNAAKLDFEATKRELDALPDGSAVPHGLSVNRTAGADATASTSSPAASDAMAYVNKQLGRAA